MVQRIYEVLQINSKRSMRASWLAPRMTFGLYLQKYTTELSDSTMFKQQT